MNIILIDDDKAKLVTTIKPEGLYLYHIEYNS